MTAIIDKEKCTACETCMDECPAQAISMNSDKAHVNNELCVDCASCVDVCPSEAIHLE
jgi:NAD-dependent dihydropyrimidine dehydrogenase PreA subunit